MHLLEHLHRNVKTVAMPTAMLQSRLYVAIVATLAPSMPPMTTAAIATGASTQTIAPCARMRSSGRSSRKTPMQATV